jgi:hypothetical protein
MAIGWLTVLKSVPWSEVISNAPKVVDGAKTLWNTVAKKPVSVKASAAPAAAKATLEGRLAAMEEAVSDLQTQMRASTEIIKELADQNAQLIRRIEANRVRVRWLTSVTAVLAVVVLVGTLVFLSR